MRLQSPRAGGEVGSPMKTTKSTRQRMSVHRRSVSCAAGRSSGGGALRHKGAGPCGPHAAGPGTPDPRWRGAGAALERRSRQNRGSAFRRSQSFPGAAWAPCPGRGSIRTPFSTCGSRCLAWLARVRPRRNDPRTCRRAIITMGVTWGRSADLVPVHRPEPAPCHLAPGCSFGHGARKARRGRMSRSGQGAQLACCRARASPPRGRRPCFEPA